MITVITGSPGAGKTLYTIQQLLLQLVGTTVKVEDDDGDLVDMPRVIYTNINGLLIEHELIDADLLRTWHEWALPGSVIVFDEWQKVWAPRPNGSKVPEEVQALDTHRHMGVDFILPTQNLNNVDRHVVGLVGRHLHIRRVASLPLAWVYEWDHASRSTLYSKSVGWKPFWFKRSTYKLYKSARAHTKMPRSVPALVWILLAALALAAYVMPSTWQRLSARLGDGFAGKTALSSSSNPTSSTTTITQGPPPGMVLTSAPGANTPERILSGVSGEPGQTPPGQIAPINSNQVAGCISIATRCKCFNAVGVELDQDEKQCKSFQVKGAPGQMGSLANERSYFTPAPTPAGLHF